MASRISRFWFVLITTTGCGGSASAGNYGSVTAADVAPREATPSGDVSPGKAGALERAAFIREVLRQNPSIEAARQALRAALARVQQAGAFEDPMVDLGVAPLSIGSSKARFGYEAQVSQRLPWFGKRGLEQAAMSAEASAARSDLEAMKRELALTALTLYDQYTVTTHALGISSHHVDMLRAMQGSATAQLESGRGSLQDPLMAELALARLEQERIAMATERDVTVAEMNELLHRAPEERLAAPPPDVTLLPAPDVLDPRRLGKDAVATRPDIVALRERARAQTARAERASREYLPDFTVSTSYNSMWDMPEHRWMVGLGFNLPLFAGTRAAAGDEATAMRAEYQSEAARLEDSARAEVFKTLAGLEQSRRVLSLFEARLLPVARQQVDAANAGFISSRNPFISVVEAERNLRELELDYVKAKADWNRRRGELDRALGLIPGLGAEGSAR